MKDMKKDVQAIRASASLPLVSRIVEIDGKPYLDGGCSDSIPIIKSLKDGNRKNVVIMTKEVGYRRKPSGHMNLLRICYRKYPKLVKMMARRHVKYNRTLDFLEEHQKKGNIFIIRPQREPGIGRLEKDEKKLKALYQMGYEDAKECFDAMMEYLNR